MEKLKKVLFYLLSFIVPVAIFLIASTINDLFPFGSNTLAVYDGSTQHPGFLNYFKEVLYGNNSCFYSFKGALGYNFFATFIYYLSSPLNLFSVFIKTEHLTIFYSILVYIKIGLCGVTSLCLLNYFNKKKTNILFSTCYALMAYNLVYYSNYMWIDSVIMCPLVILGLEKLLNENKKVFYCVTLSLSIIFNFYIGYMITIFCIIYFIYKYISNKLNKKVIKDFIILTVLSGLLCAFMLLPVFLELLNGKATLYSEPSQTNYFEGSLDFITAFYRSTIGSYNIKDISWGPPNIYCSMLVVTLVFLFFFNKNINKREKIITLSIIGFYLLGFSFNLIDYAWHFMQQPIWFPNRYTFTFSLFLILIAFKSYNNIEYLKLNKKLIISFIILFIVYLISFCINEVYLNKITQLFSIFSILLMLQYTAILIYTKYKYTFLIIMFLILELLINSFYTLKNIDFNNSVSYKIEESKSFIKDLNIIKQKEQGFYRIEFNNTPTHNNGALFNYNGINYFNSLRNSNVLNFLEHKLGVTVIDNARITFNSFNPMLNTLFGIKYFEGKLKEDFYDKISDNNRVIYKNNLTLPLMFTTNSKDVNISDNDYINNYEKIFNFLANKDVNFINEFDKELTALKETKNYYVSTGQDSSIIQTKKLDHDGWIIFNTQKDFRAYKPKIYRNEKLIEVDYEKLTPYFFKKGDHIKIIFEINQHKIKKNALNAYFLDYYKFKTVVDIINSKEAKLIDYKKDDYLKTKVSLKENSTLVSTIPYEDGWKIYVDGKKVSKKKVFNTFMGVDLKKGTYIVEFKFIPSGLILGIIISFISLMLLIIYIIKNKVNKS